MAKSKTPFFSLGSRGTIADSLTSQKRGTATLLRQKPIPTNPRTLPQMYQRWLYEDYAYLWTQQSLATRSEYRTAGSRYHLTGYQYWMKYNLQNLPDITGSWHLDETAGATSYDSSRNANHGTIFGPILTTGIISYARLFDGVNDYIRIGNAPSLDPPPTLSLEAFIYPTLVVGVIRRIITKEGSYELFLRDNGNIQIELSNALALVTVGAPCLTTHTWYHLVYTYDRDLPANRNKLYINGSLHTQADFFVGTPATTANFLDIGSRFAGTNQPFKGIIDNPIVYSRTLHPADALRHSARRYPLQ